MNEYSFIFVDKYIVYTNLSGNMLILLNYLLLKQYNVKDKSQSKL